MNSPLPSPADSIAITHWSSIKQIVASHPDDSLAVQQMIFAKAIWLKAFEAGHAKGLEALSAQSGSFCPQELLDSLNTALMDRRNAFLMEKATDLISQMLLMLPTDDLAKLSGKSTPSPQQRERPELKLVRIEESA